VHKIMLVVGPTRAGKGVIALWPGSLSNPCQPKPPDRKVSKGKRKRSGATGGADAVVLRRRWLCLSALFDAVKRNLTSAPLPTGS
jgi:hypothetical protein